ncbi:hypothetical protein QYF36_014208 [Acer negundo]|nr:hypothetical protein QYF36_014208 [Acer negundo]
MMEQIKRDIKEYTTNHNQSWTGYQNQSNSFCSSFLHSPLNQSQFHYIHITSSEKNSRRLLGENEDLKVSNFRRCRSSSGTTGSSTCSARLRPMWRRRTSGRRATTVRELISGCVGSSSALPFFICFPDYRGRSEKKKIINIISIIFL